MASAVSANITPCSTEDVRIKGNFSKSLWGNQFMNYSHDSSVAGIYATEIDSLKGYVESMLKTQESSMLDTMNVIDTIERLGISYHFQKEINETLDRFFNLNVDYEDESYDLHTIALHFRLFRQHGFRASCAVFNKFKDINGKFRDSLKSDARGILSLYEASHLGIQGEIILDDAIIFATASLKAIAPTLTCLFLKKQIEHALVQSLHFGLPRTEARTFICLYEQDESNNESLLRFAKLDYNLLQMLYKQEISNLSRWWNELDLPSKLPYIRDRNVECYFWAVSICYEPQHSRARIMLTKVINMISAIDDTYDSHGTIEELAIFTDAIDRWDISEINCLPKYMKILYKTLLDLFEEFEEELAKEERSYAVKYTIDAMKELVRSYHVEAKWLSGEICPSFSSYMANALITSTYGLVATSTSLGMGSMLKEEFKWLSKRPKVLVDSCIVCRTIDDIATYMVEKKRGQNITGIEIFMKEKRLTLEETISEFAKMATNGWKDINEERLKPSYNSRRDVLLQIILNMSRCIDVTYKDYEDGYTHPEKVLKPHIIAMLIDPLKIN